MRTGYGRTPALITATIALLATGCNWLGSGESGGSGEEPDLPLVSYRSVVVSAGPVSTAEVHVVNSVPVLSGQLADVVAEDQGRVLVASTQVKEGRWGMFAAFRLPSYPAEGDVTLTLGQNQWRAIEQAGRISIRPSRRGE